MVTAAKDQSGISFNPSRGSRAFLLPAPAIGEEGNPEETHPDNLAVVRATGGRKSPSTSPLKEAPKPTEALVTIVNKFGNDAVKSLLADLNGVAKIDNGQQGDTTLAQAAEETANKLCSMSVTEAALGLLRKAMNCLNEANSRGLTGKAMQDKVDKAVGILRNICTATPALPTGDIPTRAKPFMATAMAAADVNGRFQAVIDSATGIAVPKAKLDPEAFNIHYHGLVAELDTATDAALKQGHTDLAVHALLQRRQVSDHWNNTLKPIAQACGYEAMAELQSSSAAETLAHGQGMTSLNFLAKLASDPTFAKAVSTTLGTINASSNATGTDRKGDNKPSKAAKGSGKGGKKVVCNRCKRTGHPTEKCFAKTAADGTPLAADSS